VIRATLKGVIWMLQVQLCFVYAMVKGLRLGYLIPIFLCMSLFQLQPEVFGIGFYYVYKKFKIKSNDIIDLNQYIVSAERGWKMSEQNEYIILVKLTLAGDHEAYGELYEKTVTDVYRTVRFLVHDAADAEDLVQEIYIQAYRSLARYDNGRAFRPWLMGVSMRQVKSYRRRKMMQFRFKQRIEQMDTDTGMEVDFSSQLIHRLANRPLLAQVQRLPYKLQQVVTLHYLNEYTQEEVADILDIPLGTVKSRIHAALTKLRQKQQLHSEFARKVDNANEIG